MWSVVLIPWLAAAGPGVEPGAMVQPSHVLPQEVAGLKFEQKLNAQVPENAWFHDESGKKVQLGDFLKDRPVILVLAYYRCPQLCNLVLNGLVDSMRGMNLSLGKDYSIVTISFDPEEEPDLAAAKKKHYLEYLGKPNVEASWRFLTGEKSQIDRVAESVGFGYEFDKAHDRYNHPSGIVVLTPSGRVSRYLFGISYPTRDLRLALVEASEGKIGGLVDQLMLFCFHYDQLGGKYSFAVMNALRVISTGFMVVLLFFVVRYVRREKRTHLPTSEVTT